jgi:hypothetical protein
MGNKSIQDFDTIKWRQQYVVKLFSEITIGTLFLNGENLTPRPYAPFMCIMPINY